MNNTKSLAIVAVLAAATLVIGVTFAATTTPSAFADKKDDGNMAPLADSTTGGGDDNGGDDNGGHTITCINDQPCKTTVQNSNTTHNRFQQQQH
jgi:hypothetical protein